MKTLSIFTICATFAFAGAADALPRDPRPTLTRGETAVMLSCLGKSDSRTSERNGRWMCCSVKMQACLVCQPGAAGPCKVIKTGRQRR